MLIVIYYKKKTNWTGAWTLKSIAMTSKTELEVGFLKKIILVHLKLHIHMKAQS